MNIEDKLINIRRHIHRTPELSWMEYRTSDFILSELKNSGINARKIAKTGVVGLISSENSKRCLAFRSDLDALPLTEKTKKDYASQNPGVMHACGHDANATIVLGASLLLSKEKKLGGAIKFIFQPAEEASGGAAKLIEEGVLKNPEVDAIVGVHVHPEYDVGTIALKYGDIMASVDKFTVEVVGTGGHTAYPHRGSDPIIASAKIIDNWQSIVSMMKNPVEPVVITVGKISGGEKCNILATKVTLEGTLRCIDRKLQRQIINSMKNILEHICKIYNCSYTFTHQNLSGPLINSKKMVDVCLKAAKKVFNKVVMMDKPSMGGEDFAEYLKYIPGAFVYIGVRNKKCSFPWHHPSFDIDEEALLLGSKFLVEVAYEYFKMNVN